MRPHIKEKGNIMSDTSAPSVLVDIDARGIATVTLNRPDVNNAYDGQMVDMLRNGAKQLGQDDSVRVIVIKGNGKHFQAGADLSWLNQVRTQSPEENLAVSQGTTDAIRALDECPKPTIALVHGACFGGGTGIISACDVVVAADDALFSIAEVRWGLHAGPILPQLSAAIGPRQVRRYALTAERFGAETAAELGLVHEVCARDELDAWGAKLADAMLKNGPTALAETKRIMMDEVGLGIADDAALRLAQSHSRQRQTDEGTEGLLSFKEKREAAWYPGPVA
jgi:methylglutaconyl-CoA hydratase